VIAIVGGGISGLAAAYELTIRRLPFALFEASPRLGGLVRTERVEGFTIEAGADSMLAQKRAGIDLCQELGLGARLLSMNEPRTASVYAGGVLHPLPSPAMLGIPATWRGLASYSLLPLATRARVAMEPLIPTAAREDESVADFFRRRFGRGTIRPLVQPLVGGIHAGDIETLSIRSTLPRLAETERSGRRLLPWIRRTARAAEAGGAFRSLASGMGELVESIARRLPDGAVHCNTPVTALARTVDGWQVSAGGASHPCAAVILACPAYVAADLLRTAVPDVASLCDRVRYVSTASVGLAFTRESVGHPLTGSGFVVARARADVRITACTYVSSKWQGRAPAGHVLLRAYLGGAHDPDAVDLEDEALIGIVQRELSAILSIRGAPLLARVYRWRRAGAQHEVGHLAWLRVIESQLQKTPGLFVTGSGFRSVGVPDCLADGRAVAATAGTFIHEA
jgi:protoporphyrinogen/coproporphyrinogen III oxidase